MNIIIPCYNSHKTLDRCIGSILTQTEKCTVTLINDGGENYSDIIQRYSPVLDIQELDYKENKGVGYARNYGIEHTDGEFILFLDSDDALASPYALQILKAIFNNPNIMFVVSSILAENPDNTVRIIKQNKTYLHGKMFRRSYIDKYNIRFKESSCCEDSGFTILNTLLLNGTTEKEEVIDFISYYWLNNPYSLGRKNPEQWEKCNVIKGCVDNYIYVFDELEKRNRDNARILLEKALLMLSLLNMYKKANGYEEENFKVIKQYYDKVYKKVHISNKVFEQAFNLLNLKGRDTLFDIKRLLKQMEG